MTPSNFLDLTEQPFGYWIVITRATNDKRGKTRWWCQCRCGTQRMVHAESLTRGLSHSCGCLRDEIVRDVQQTHGLSKSPEYRIWNTMRQRCGNPRVRRYKNHGGRGITVCDAWQESFLAFYADMGPRPGLGYTLEREHNDGPYDKTNCVWATPQEQARNTRTNRLLTSNGKTQCLQAWAEEMQLNPGTISRRLARGWSLEKALMTPIDHEYMHKRNLNK